MQSTQIPQHQLDKPTLSSTSLHGLTWREIQNIGVGEVRRLALNQLEHGQRSSYQGQLWSKSRAMRTNSAALTVLWVFEGKI